MTFARQRVIVVDLWTDTNNWAAVADPRLYPTIGMGYRYGRTPEMFSRGLAHRRADVHQRHHAGQGALLLRRRPDGLSRAVQGESSPKEKK